jgi:predicted nucleic acid-binding protein
LYLDTSAVLRATLEAGTTPELEKQIRAAEVLLTSRLALVEASRAFRRAAALREATPTRLVDAERDVEALWARCEIWELTSAICDSARILAPQMPLRALDALHLATYLAARRRLGDVQMLTIDDRLARAVETAI